MRPTDTLLSALAADPADDAAWLALADCLEEEGQDREAELTRLREGLRVTGERPRSRDRRHGRLAGLLAAGVRPVMPRRVVPVEGGREMGFVLIPPGSFWMGSPMREQYRFPNEGPRHKVRLTRGFWLGETTVTQRQWQTLMGSNPSQDEGPGPVTHINWHECLELCRRLRERTGWSFRLPSEAEWEYACRATSTSPFSSGSSEQDAFRAGWHRPDTRINVHEVGRKEPNAWGLYDMHGNVWEWCLDGKREYHVDEVIDPLWELRAESVRVLRGGSYDNGYRDARSACRGWARHAERAVHWGVRLAISLDDSDPALSVMAARS